METTITIGGLARQSGVGIETIRFYERKGLLAAPQRSKAGYRLYRQREIDRLRFIRRAKALGFTLKEIKELLSLRHTPGTSKADIRKRALVKVNNITSRIGDLEKIREGLLHLIFACNGHGPVDECPIIEALEGDRDP